MDANHFHAGNIEILAHVPCQLYCARESVGSWYTFSPFRACVLNYFNSFSILRCQHGNKFYLMQLCDCTKDIISEKNAFLYYKNMNLRLELHSWTFAIYYCFERPTITRFRHHCSSMKQGFRK